MPCRKLKRSKPASGGCRNEHRETFSDPNRDAGAGADRLHGCASGSIRSIRSGCTRLRVLGGRCFCSGCCRWPLASGDVRPRRMARRHRLSRGVAPQPELPPHLFGWSLAYLCGTKRRRTDGRSTGCRSRSILLFTLGVVPRITGVLTWVAVVSYTANPALAYDADPLLAMLAFYLMVGYLLPGQYGGQRRGDAPAGAARGTWLFRKRRAAEPPAAERRREPGAAVCSRCISPSRWWPAGWTSCKSRSGGAALAPWFYLNAPYPHQSRDVAGATQSRRADYLALFSLSRT